MPPQGASHPRNGSHIPSHFRTQPSCGCVHLSSALATLEPGLRRAEPWASSPGQSLRCPWTGWVHRTIWKPRPGRGNMWPRFSQMLPPQGLLWVPLYVFSVRPFLRPLCSPFLCSRASLKMTCSSTLAVYLPTVLQTHHHPSHHNTLKLGLEVKMAH